MPRNRLLFVLALLGTVFFQPALNSQQQSGQTQLSVREVMNTIVAPTTATLWGAWDIETDAQWQELEQAAAAVIGAGERIAQGGSGPRDNAWAAEPEWQQYNQQMIDAARTAITAIRARDMDALSSAGNDLLYPPCESCHQKYMSR